VVKPLGTASDPALTNGHAPFPAGFAKVLAKIAFVQDPDGETLLVKPLINSCAHAWYEEFAGHWIELVPQSIHG